ncbi:DUF2279 domain-containing protein [Hugenholtzia roseola]|uniref:DUF2279 domain-containing protein n=1 Tax=Hugenholtzia roseola TaxID=1002 RepID=UPI0004092313|nr:DUF2279 domain-containing protein [Hugenholtzia roseola]
MIKRKISKLGWIYALFLAALIPLCKGAEKGKFALSDSLPQKQTANKETKKKTKFVPFLGLGTAYGAGLYGLDRLWYAKAPRSPFHFFDDSPQWRQMDKLGHAYTTYQIGRLGEAFFRKSLPDTPKNRKIATWVGGSLGFLMLLPVEILDGFSAAYGASLSDLGANAFGSFLFIGQELAFSNRHHRQKIKLKFSYQPSPYAPLRPNVLGSNFMERLLKDYNGQRYWLSFSPLPARSKVAFLSLSVGYSANKMLYGRENENNAAGFVSYRSYYLSLDVDWERIQTQNKFVKTLFFFVNCIKIPAPTLFWDRKNKWQSRILFF